MRLILFVFFTILVSSPTWADKAYAFSLPSIYDGQSIALDDYRGQVVLIDFWASWCGPCQASMPAYNDLRNKLQRELGENQFEVIAINVDVTREEGLQFLERFPVNFPVVREETGKSQEAYQILAMPSAFLVDPEGNIQLAHSGFSPGFVVELEKHVKHLLKPSNTSMPQRH